MFWYITAGNKVLHAWMHLIVHYLPLVGNGYRSHIQKKWQYGLGAHGARVLTFFIYFEFARVYMIYRVQIITEARCK